MASIRTGSIVSDIRGSVGTETYARNQGGIYVRARTTPEYKNTAAQQACRGAMTDLSRYWSSTLTLTQRTAWRKYARQHPKPNRWGNLHLVNGYTRFIEINFHRYRLDSAVAFPSPPTQAHLHQPIFTFTADGLADTVTIALPPSSYSPPWPDLELFAYGGDNISPGVNFYASPWRYIARNKFNAAWTSDPWTIDYPLDLIATDQVFLRLIAQNSDTGELSEAYQTSAIIA